LAFGRISILEPPSDDFLYFHSAPLPSILGLRSMRRPFNFNLKVWKDDLIDPVGELLAPSVILTLWPNKALQLTPSRLAPLFHDRLSFPFTSLQSLRA